MSKPTVTLERKVDAYGSVTFWVTNTQGKKRGYFLQRQAERDARFAQSKAPGSRLVRKGFGRGRK